MTLERISLERAPAGPVRLPAGGAAGVEIKVFADLAAAEETWRGLQLAAHTEPQQSFNWVAAWARTGGSAQDLRVVAGFDAGGACLFLLPLAITNHVGIRVLEWLGNGQGNYAAGLFHSAFLEDAAWASFADLWCEVLAALPPVDAVHLADQPRELGRHENPFLALPHAVSPEPGRWFALDPDWRRHHEARFSSSSRRELHRCERRLADRGALAFIHATEPETRRRVFAAMIAQKRAQFANSGIDDFFADGAIEAFYARLMDALQDPDGLSLQLFALQCGGDIVATNMGVMVKNRFYGLISSTAAGPLRRFAPGNILFLRMVGHLAGAGVEVLDCGAGGDAHKLRWCTGERARFHTIEGLTLQGELYARGLQSHLALKRAVKHSSALWPIAKEVRRLKGRTLRLLAV